MNHPENHDRRLHMIMNIFMIFLILTSITLTVLESSEAFMTPGKKQIFLAIHLSILIVFFAEFLYRLWRAPLRSPELSPLRARMHFLIQPFTIIDIIVIVPLFIMIWTRDLHDADGVVLRILRFTSMLNVFRFYQSSRVIRLIHDIGHEVWHELLIVFILSLQCIIISGVLFYAAENGTNPDVKNIFDGIWWSVVTLTTIGYGDIVPITVSGKMMGMALALIGVGLVALPTGILASGFVRALRSEKKIIQLAEEFEEEEEEQAEILERVENIEKKIKTTRIKRS